MAPKRRRETNLGPFAGLYSSKRSGASDELHLLALGLAFEPVEDAGGEATAALEQGLLPWSLMPDVTVDRFDARLLLHDMSALAPAPAAREGEADDEEDDSALHAERYGDLEAAEEQLRHGSPSTGSGEGGMEAEEEAATARHRGRGASSGYNAVGLSYGDEPEEPDQALGEELYVPRFEVPPDLARLLWGVTETGHKVMLNTARFVAEAGGQAELVLRARQSTNPHFAFLRPDSRLQPYFRWLVRVQPQEREAPEAGATEPHQDGAGNIADGANGVSGLGHLLQQYGSQGGESASEAAAEAEEHQGPGTQPAGAGETEEGEAAAEPDLAAEAAEAGPAAPAALQDADVATPSSADEAAAAAVPADVAAVMAKMVAYIQKNGAQFEARLRRREQANPRFAFLAPGNQYHAYYREKLREALGPDQTRELFAAMPAPEPAAVEGLAAVVADRPVADSVAAAAAPEAAPAAPATVKASATNAKSTGGMAIRANPKLAKVAFVPRRPQTVSAADAEQPEPAEEEPKEETQQPTDTAADPQDSRGEQRGAGVSSMQDGEGADDWEAEGTPPESSEAASAADKARKAQRRRLVQQLLASSSSVAVHHAPFMAAAVQLPPAPHPPPASAVATHRLALLAEQDDDTDVIAAAPPLHGAQTSAGAAGTFSSGAAAGHSEIAVPALPAAAAATVPPVPAAVALPKLEEIIRPRIVRSPSPLVMSPPASSSSASSDMASSEYDRSRRREGARRSREERRPSSRNGDSRRESHSRGKDRSGHRRSKRSRSRSRSRSRRKEKDRGVQHKRHRDGRSMADDRDAAKPRHRKNMQRKAKGKQHDWGIHRDRKAASPAEQAERSPKAAGAPVDVPDALRARIKAMLAAG